MKSDVRDYINYNIPYILFLLYSFYYKITLEHLLPRRHEYFEGILLFYKFNFLLYFYIFDI